MVVINTIAVEVRDVTDSALLDAVRQVVNQTFKHLAGTWDVRVSASADAGRWDLHVRGGFGHHVSYFLTSPQCLAEHVERRLRAFLNEVVPPLSVAPRRPVLVARRTRSDRTTYDLARRFSPLRRKAS